ncbi:MULTISPECIES: SDR family oxidoreductase [Bacillus cereus group]|uniref:Short chain dehydrogenase n=1 Tax=Bacillus cereus TaxID=1396 RepID=A0AA44TCV2_BACCE|nr:MULTISPECIES: SDR family oxidoreductase [Bacillus cereus group]PFA24228.1 short chain dehydrogenase [Bacillus cereus]PFN09665.1 short chain dehydrogenase [Bacillus cereus]PFO81574.1 short chain dehydrogenase [Bacillus cereus]PFR25490.1 short chain dehydrogenase [Bacillus cereus]PFR96064.1 short chain dehydrogenase [Bacillus cereus]
MTRRLQEKVIVITGASSGIGEQVAMQVAAQGAVPVLIARTEEKLKRLTEKMKTTYNTPCYYYVLDVSKESEVETVFARILQDIGQIDILVNNAGFGIFKTFEEASMTEVKEMFEVNVFGLVACTKAVLPHMLERNSGQIVNVASLAGKIATPKSSAYAASKHAVLGFTNSLRMELSNTNIYVTAINPGPIDTNFFDIADQSGTYVKNMGRYMLKPTYVAEQIVKVMQTKKREVNLPKWMSMGPKIFALFPGLFERIAGKSLSKK